MAWSASPTTNDGNYPTELNNVSAIFDVNFVAGGAPPPIFIFLPLVDPIAGRK
ncbi:MAG: hypothetical protein RMJ48_12510 [Roseiflexaceae bacterium]|nr:hypothetical protein [Roseiflexaceae bacterium]